MKSIVKNKNSQRLRRAVKTRSKIADSGNHRISVHRSIQHMYLQLISPMGDKVLTTISTNQKVVKLRQIILRVQKELELKWLITLKRLKLRMLLLTDQATDIMGE